MVKSGQKQSTPAFKPHRKDRERLVLHGLVELYINSGKPVGSQTLKEHGFEGLSSATIRNYFSKLEKAGMLEQQHSSGGRIPTARAFVAYAQSHQSAKSISGSDLNLLKRTLLVETKETHRYMEQAAELLSELSGCAVFLSMPRFDQDFVIDVKLVEVDASRCLAVLVTEFGLVHTELLHTQKKLSNHALKRVEAFFHYRMTGLDEPNLSEDEQEIAIRFYKEVMLRHVVKTASFSHADLYKTGFSKLLQYPEFNSSLALASGLSLFEDEHALEKLLESCNDLQCLIGDETLKDCASLICPYSVQNRRVGAIGILGPKRIPYPKLFALLKAVSELISEGLTRNLYKFKITFRQPGESLLLEDKRGNT